jgi:transcriptional regulator with XRE-family HTH domain
MLVGEVTETRTKLRNARLEAGLTADQVAQKLGVHPNSLLMWERGETEPMGQSLLNLSKLYQKSPDELLKND